jgi:hypothetical protein
VGPPSYRLRDHIYACCPDGQAVLLDLKRDAYFGLDAEQTLALRGLVEDWPVCAVSNSRVSLDEARGLAAELERRGILRLSLPFECAEPDTRYPSPCVVQEQLIPWDQMSAANVRAGRAFRFIRSALVVALLMRVCTLRFLIDRARRRKSLALSRGAVFDKDRARELLNAFYYMRAFLYGKKARCLFDSAVLVEFLACYGLFPQWVFGVQSRPFAAHSWVQSDAAVLNGTPEFVRAYTPILVI